ncbi:GapA-binding peptide SR1P [Paenibacillus sp. HJGM_3]|uniref:GapA-binding peptide SR1P n=1 Tax=Paenibacillus sp. HJGM_3 TaxID=3379816 RepID=UPI00385A17F1
MEKTTMKLNLGVILCKHCSAIIDTVDSDNVVTYYSVCQDPSCTEATKKEQPDWD